MKSMSSGPLSLMRAFDAGEQLHRPQVDVLVEAEPQIEEQLPLEDAGLHVGMADRAEQDRVELAQLVEPVGGQCFAGLEVAIAAPVEMREVELEPVLLGHRLQHLHALGRHFRTRTVATNHRDLLCFTHDRSTVLSKYRIHHNGTDGHDGKASIKITVVSSVIPS